MFLQLCKRSLCSEQNNASNQISLTSTQNRTNAPTEISALTGRHKRQKIRRINEAVVVAIFQIPEFSCDRCTPRHSNNVNVRHCSNLSSIYRTIQRWWNRGLNVSNRFLWTGGRLMREGERAAFHLAFASWILFMLHSTYVCIYILCG